MKAENLRIIAARLRETANALQVLAGQVEAEAPHLGVNLPRDLFSDIDEPQPVLFDGITTTHKDADGTLHSETKAVPPYNELPTTPAEQLPPAKRHYQRIGKAQGYCARSDIERSLVRLTGRSREDVREAVNRIAERMQLTCVKSRSYRYYPRALRDRIVNESREELQRI